MQSAVRRFGWFTIERLLLLIVIALQVTLLLYRNPQPHPDAVDLEGAPSTAGGQGVGASELDASDVAAPEPTAIPPHPVSPSGRMGLGWPGWPRMASVPQEEIRQLMNRDWGRLQRAPAMDVVEQPDAFIVLFSLPHVQDEEIGVRMDRGILTLDLPFGSAHDGHYGRLVRRLQIPGVAANVTQPHYVLTNGVLRVYLPKMAGHATSD